MKTILTLISCVGLAASSLAVAQDKVPPAKPVPGAAEVTTPTGPAPEISFDKMKHEFGVINDEKPVDVEFTFTNKGKATLEITSTTGSCGCTVPALEKKAYEPGESGTIKVSYNPHGRRGKQHTNVTVMSNDPARPQLTLEIHSEVKPQLMVEPQAVNFAQAIKGQPTVVKAAIVSRNKNILPTSVTASVAYLQPTLLAPVEAVVDGESVVQIPIEITVLPSAPVGQVTGNIAIRTNDPARLLNLTVTGEVVGDLVAKPARVQLNSLQPGSAIKTSVRVEARAGKAFKVTKVEEAPAGAPLFNVQVSEDNSTQPPSYVLNIMGTAPSASGAFRGDLVVHTDLPDEPIFKIPYFGFARAQPRPAAPADPWAANPSPLMK